MVDTLYQLRSPITSHLPSGNLKRLIKSLTNLSSDTEDSNSGTELTSPEVEASNSDVEHQIVYLTSQNHIPDQINWSSDWSHLQQTFHLSSNPLRMHNPSSSSASSSTHSCDFDPDLIIPDGPLTLLHEQTFINLVVLNLRMRMRNKVEEAEDDIDEGFFDDIEFPSKFGIPNNFHQTSIPSNPSSSLPSSKLHKPTESVHLSSSDSSRIVDEHYHQPKSSSTQSFVTAPIIPSSSSSTTIAAPSSGPQKQPRLSSSSSSSSSSKNIIIWSVPMGDMLTSYFYFEEQLAAEQL
ncbi:hypothetical protein BY996DRAFT_6574366 [Phakopsora pachyrhizi]|nr:hypothetical protein BY996DRAFT_6574366 [Phakopsora pachyrhizi]